MTTRALVKAAYAAVVFDGYQLDLSSLSPDERSTWDEIARRDTERRDAEDRCDYDAFPDGFDSV